MGTDPKGDLVFEWQSISSVESGSLCWRASSGGLVGVSPILGFPFREACLLGAEGLGLAGAFILVTFSLVTPIDMDSNIKCDVMFVFLFQEIVSKVETWNHSWNWNEQIKVTLKKWLLFCRHYPRTLNSEETVKSYSWLNVVKTCN